MFSSAKMELIYRRNCATSGEEAAQRNRDAVKELPWALIALFEENL